VVQVPVSVTPVAHAVEVGTARATSMFDEPLLESLIRGDTGAPALSI
jgi:hypothetical protein